MICIFEWKRESQLKCKKCFSSTAKRDQHWLEEKVPPDNDLCFVKFQSMILSPVADQLPLPPASLLVHNF